MAVVVGTGTALAIGCGPSPDTLASKHLALLQAGEMARAQQQYCLPTTDLLLHDVTRYELLSLTHKSRNQLPYMEVVISLDSDQTRRLRTATGWQDRPIDHAVIEIWESDNFFDWAVLMTAHANTADHPQALLTGTPAAEMAVPRRTDVNAANQCIFLPADQFADD